MSPEKIGKFIAKGMEYKNILQVDCRKSFREWLSVYSELETECWVNVKRGKPVDDTHFWYIDAVEEALCYGWIDSTHRIIDGKRLKRFTSRKKGSKWTELNKERVCRLDALGLMTDVGRAVLPAMGIRSFHIDPGYSGGTEGCTCVVKVQIISSFIPKGASGKYRLL